MRRTWVRILLVLLAVAFVYMLLVGLGLTGRKGKKSPKRVQVLNDFEDPANDLQWASGGYVQMETSVENLTHGKRSAKATFLLARQFFPTPTPDAVWQPALKLTHKTVTPLTGSAYDTLNVDVFNPGTAPITLRFEVTDGKGYAYAVSVPSTPLKVTNAAVSLSLLKSERLDLTSLAGLSIVPDLTGAADPVVVYLDYLRLEGEPIVQKKKKK
jgi:hypothetical protein